MSEHDSARKYARRRLKAKNTLKVLLAAWVGVSALLMLVWTATGAHQHFWPIWPMGGIGIAILVVAFTAYGPRVGYVSDHDVDAEIARLNSRLRQRS
jgi:uncharacterized membrane protein